MNAPEQHIPRPTPVCDVVSYFSCCSDTFGQLAAILDSIERGAGSIPASEIKKLAQAGSYLADHFENIADCWREEVEKNSVRID